MINGVHWIFSGCGFSVQCDQIGRFFKVPGNKFVYKSNPKMFTFGLLWQRSINVKTTVDIFRQLVETFGQLFTPKTGHTGSHRKFWRRKNQHHHEQSKSNGFWDTLSLSFLTFLFQSTVAFPSTVGRVKDPWFKPSHRQYSLKWLFGVSWIDWKSGRKWLYKNADESMRPIW